MTRAEKKAKREKYHARRVVEAYRDHGARRDAALDALTKEVEMLRQTRDVFREMLWAAMLGRALGSETPLTEAFVARNPAVFRGHESEPWRVFGG